MGHVGESFPGGLDGVYQDELRLQLHLRDEPEGRTGQNGDDPHNDDKRPSTIGTSSSRPPGSTASWTFSFVWRSTREAAQAFLKDGRPSKARTDRRTRRRVFEENARMSLVHIVQVHQGEPAVDAGRSRRRLFDSSAPTPRLGYIRGGNVQRPAEESC